MTLPTTYDETTFAEYLNSVLGDAAGVLGWSVVSLSYDEVINDVMYSLGITDLSDAVSLQVLRAVGRREVWKAAINGFITKYDFTLEFQSFKRSQMFKNAIAAYEMAIQDTVDLGISDTSSTATFIPVVDIHDPYITLNDSIRRWP